MNKKLMASYLNDLQPKTKRKNLFTSRSIQNVFGKTWSTVVLVTFSLCVFHEFAIRLTKYLKNAGIFLP